jgi:hypothetical protein
MTTPEDPAPQPSVPPPRPSVPPPQYGAGEYGVGYGEPSPPTAYGYGPMPGTPGYARYGPPTGPIGHIRPTGMMILLFFVTLGIWGFVYYYQAHEEMKRHSGEGLGGVLALVISILFGFVSPYLLSNEVGNLYERIGREKPVSAVTALWFFPGLLILVGPFIWFIRTNNALNDYWLSLGAVERGASG